MPEPAMPFAAVLALMAVGGYLLGSIPFGVILTRLGGAGDVRSIGSGNIGATNVLRTGRKDLAIATLLLDAGKGAAALLLAKALMGGASPNAEIAGAVAGGAASEELADVKSRDRAAKAGRAKAVAARGAPAGLP